MFPGDEFNSIEWNTDRACHRNIPLDHSQKVYRALNKNYRNDGKRKASTLTQISK